MGLYRLGTVAIDATKVKASRHKTTSCERMKLAEADFKTKTNALLTRAKATDEAEA